MKHVLFSVVVPVPLSVLLFPFRFPIRFIVFAILFSRSASGNSDPASHSRLFSPIRITIRVCTFMYVSSSFPCRLKSAALKHY